MHNGCSHDMIDLISSLSLYDSLLQTALYGYLKFLGRTIAHFRKFGGSTT